MRLLRPALALFALVGWAAMLGGCSKGEPPPPVVRPAEAPDGGDAGAASARPEAKRVGQIASVKGTVTLERNGASRPAGVEALHVGDVLETGADGEAALSFAGERLVELGADGRFVVREGEGGVVLDVERGLVLSRVPKAPVASSSEGGEVRLTIATPFGLTRIGASEVKLNVEPEGATVDVKVGELEVVGKDGTTVKLSAGAIRRLGQVRELEPIALAIVVKGRAERKAKGARTFSAIDPQAPPTLEVGDVVRVKDGTVAFQAQGLSTRLTLTKGAEVALGPSSRGPGREEVDLTLARGELAVSAPGGQTTRVALGGGVALTTERGGQFIVRRTPTGFDVDSLVGDAQLERSGAEPVLLPGGAGARLTAKGVTVREAVREVVALPSREELRLYASQLSRLALTWDGPDGREWRVQVAREPTFSEPFIDGTVKERFLNVPLGPRGTLYWRVYDGETLHEKGSLVYGPEPRSHDLSLLKNVVPEGPEKTTIYYQDKPPLVTFTWSPEEGAVRYRLEVFREGALASPVAERTVKETSVALPAGTLGEGRYLWSVTPLGPRDEALRGGRMNKLEMTYDNAVPELVIRSPQNGEAAGAQVPVVGIAPVGARLFVNGRPVPLDDKARFSTTAAPLAGGHVVFRLLNAGAESYTVRTVRRSR